MKKLNLSEIAIQEIVEGLQLIVERDAPIMSKTKDTSYAADLIINIQKQIIRIAQETGTPLVCVSCRELFGFDTHKAEAHMMQTGHVVW